MTWRRTPSVWRSGTAFVVGPVHTVGELAVKAPSEDQIGYGHLECLDVIIVDEERPPTGDAA